MEITETLYVTDRREWRRWLKQHYRNAPEIWLVSYRKGTGKPSLLYNDAVEEALCFGWIDSQLKSIDAERYAQRYSPRKSLRDFSPPNIVRLQKLLRQGKVIRSVRDHLPPAIFAKFVIPSDILKELQRDSETWHNFQRFSPAYHQIRIGYIDGARSRPAEFRKRLRHFLKFTKSGKQIGYGGVEKNY